jgi:hypothetical protein
MHLVNACAGASEGTPARTKAPSANADLFISQPLGPEPWYALFTMGYRTAQACYRCEYL